jgi:hypothetical protein
VINAAQLPAWSSGQPGFLRSTERDHGSTVRAHHLHQAGAALAVSMIEIERVE